MWHQDVGHQSAYTWSSVCEYGAEPELHSAKMSGTCLRQATHSWSSACECGAQPELCGTEMSGTWLRQTACPWSSVNVSVGLNMIYICKYSHMLWLGGGRHAGMLNEKQYNIKLKVWLVEWAFIFIISCGSSSCSVLLHMYNDTNIIVPPWDIV